MKDSAEGTIRFPKGVEKWETPESANLTEWDMVTVFSAKTGEKVLRGKVARKSDALGNHGGIIETDAKGNIISAIQFPNDRDEWRNEMSKWRFLVERKE